MPLGAGERGGAFKVRGECAAPTGDYGTNHEGLSSEIFGGKGGAVGLSLSAGG